MKKKLHNIKQSILHKKSKITGETDQSQVVENPARITNETVAEHREEVIGKARKYIYPLSHSKHKIIVISISLFIVSIVVFFTYCVFALYRIQSSSTFIYRVTQVIPFPIARTGGSFISYEDYLFELRHYMHYYETQQELDFNTDAGQKQLAEFRHRALDKVINDAYVKKLAKEHNVTVSSQDVDNQITIVRSQNRLGDSQEVFEDVLRDFWGWSVDDFKRSLKDQLLAQKVVATLDIETNARASAALGELQAGADFKAVAEKYSDDQATKVNGGDFGFPINKANRDLSAITTDALFKLKPGEYSEIINIGYALEIVKANSEENGKVLGAHILFNFKDISEYVNDLKEKQPTKTYVTLPKSDLAQPTENN